jgi:hypothetical protein
MTKYIEELNNGDAFILNNGTYILSSDFKKNGDKLSISLVDGNSRWVKPNEMIEHIQLFIMDKENNIIAIKESKKENVDNQA